MANVEEALRASGWTVHVLGDLVLATRLDCFTTSDGFGSVDTATWIGILQALQGLQETFAQHRFEIVQSTPSGIAMRDGVGIPAIQAAFPDWGDSTWHFCGMMWVLVRAAA
jgi:hypothetical protein